MPSEVLVPNTKPMQLPNPTPTPPRETPNTAVVTNEANTKQETKTHGANPVINGEKDIPAFDDVLDMDSLCGLGGLPYPFDNEQTRTTDGQTQPI